MFNDATESQVSNMKNFFRPGASVVSDGMAHKKEMSSVLPDLDTIMSDMAKQVNRAPKQPSKIGRNNAINMKKPPQQKYRTPQPKAFDHHDDSFNTPDNNIDFEHNPDENFQNDHNIQDDVPNPVDDDSAIVMDTVVDVKPKVEEEVQKKVIVKTKKILKGTEATVKVTSEMLNKPSLPDFNDQSYGSFTGPETAIDMSAAMNIDTSAWLKTTEAKEDGTPGEEYVDFYYIDASEVKGVVYLFGKIPIIDKAKNNESRYVSCVVQVHGCERNLFVLPARVDDNKLSVDGKPIRHGLAPVHQEITNLLVPTYIPRSQGQAFKAKKVVRKYAFDDSTIPREETEYLKIVYPAVRPALPLEKCGRGQYIEKIFGSGSSALELFLMKRRLMGPGWLVIKNPLPSGQAISFARVELQVRSPKFITKATEEKRMAAPALVSMSISMKTAVNPQTHMHEILVISGVVHSKIECDADSSSDGQFIKRFTYVRQLGQTCGPGYPSVWPSDLQAQAKNANFPVETFLNERMLLSRFFSRIKQEDPDVLVSHNLFGWEFDVLLNRASVNKVGDWSVLGRLRKSTMPKSINDRDGVSGRLLCDTYKAAKEFLRETSYSLTHLAASQLKINNRIEVDPMDVPKYFTCSKDILSLAYASALDAFIVHRLMLKLQCIPLTKQLTNVSGNLWHRTMRGARAERIEYLLLHEFHSAKYIVPEKKPFENKRVVEDGDDDEAENKVGGKGRTRAKAAYAGGLVLEPKKGLYDTYILLLDFNSLYPSIIQEYNLCFTTVNYSKYMEPQKPVEAPKKESKKSNKGGNINKEDDDDLAVASDDEEEAEVVSNLPPLPDSSEQKGILPKVIKTLVDRRREVKKLLAKEKDVNRKQEYDIRQKALKLTANSMYGCLGFSFSRFYARPIAALITSKGREALQETVQLAERELGLEVIYGDTDSVMINTNCTDLDTVKKIGTSVKNKVNSKYECLELDLDGIFKSMLLLKKKKYAALVIKEEGNEISYEKELKGLDLVRRDWCPLSKNIGKKVVDEILSGKSREEIVTAIHEEMRNLGNRVRNGEEDMAKFIVTKSLNKSPKDYPDAKGQPHLQVALAMLKANKPVNVGDHIPYLICKEGPEDSSKIAMRAYHPDEVSRSNGALNIDYDWYLAVQILPPITRLLDPIEGTSEAQLCQLLGLDSAKYARKTINNSEFMEDDYGFQSRCQMEDSERFKECARLKCNCHACGEEFEFLGLSEAKSMEAGFSCTTCGSLFMGLESYPECYTYVSNRVTLLVRQCLKQYYDCWLVCDDHSCNMRTTQQSIMGMRCTNNCHGRMVQEYDDVTLYTQLKYLETLFDLDRSEKKMKEKLDKEGIFNSYKPSPSEKELYRILKAHMTNTINVSAYNWVRPKLFSTVFGVH